MEADLSVIHPEIASYGPYRAWVKVHGLARWAEYDRAPDGKQTVMLQEERKGTAAEKRDVTQAGMFIMEVQGSKALDHREFSSDEVFHSYEAAGKKYGFDQIDTASVMPIVDFESPNPISWRFRTLVPRQKVVTISGDEIIEETVPPVSPPTPHECSGTDDDGFLDNDLHHPHDLGIVADAVRLAGNGTVHDMAKSLCHAVHNQVKYQALLNCDLFTDSDFLTRERGFGICDEMAVLLVTYLRAVGIPARVKFLRWTRKKEQVHACVEYYVDSEAAWFHLDPTWDKIHQPEVYLKTLVDGGFPKDVRVVDVFWPSDARSSSDIDDDLEDKLNDGRLNPWGDFCYSPTMKGVSRPGYSQ
jgi:hypothetical protein